MNRLTTTIYTDSGQLPVLNEGNYFHSRRLFDLFRQTPRHKPYMVVATAGDGRLVGHLLAVVRYRTSWLPPYLYSHCRVLGEGVYYDEGSAGDVAAADGAATASTHDEVLGAMLRAVVRQLAGSVLYIEVSHLSRKMAGYREFRRSGFFGVRWMSIHNSLHSRTPEERISERLQRRIALCEKRGVVTAPVNGDADFTAFMKLLKAHNVPKLKRYVPHERFFRGMADSGDAYLLLTRYRTHVIGCSMLLQSQGNGYLWYAAYRRKSFAFVHPDVMTIWHTIKYAYAQGLQHIFFMDVGLPFRKSAFREFILGFGGKPTSTRRWFRFSVRWLNALLTWIYRN